MCRCTRVGGSGCCGGFDAELVRPRGGGVPCDARVARVRGPELKPAGRRQGGGGGSLGVCVRGCVGVCGGGRWGRGGGGLGREVRGRGLKILRCGGQGLGEPAARQAACPHLPPDAAPACRTPPSALLAPPPTRLGGGGGGGWGWGWGAGAAGVRAGGWRGRAGCGPGSWCSR